MTKAELKLITYLIIIGAPIFLIIKLGEIMGWELFICSLAVIVGVVIWIRAEEKKSRRKMLLNKYQDNQLVEKIMTRSFWVGQTEEQLMDSLGKPSAIDNKLLKTKKKEVWKYSPQGANRYGLRITLENDEVVGWDQKG